MDECKLYVINRRPHKYPCYFCGEKRSVKYEVEMTILFEKKRYSCCNKCALSFIGRSENDV